MSRMATKILDAAQELTQRRGFNAFSYADIATEVGIRKASIHYHFPSKTDLGRELISRYRGAFGNVLHEIDAKESGSLEKLKSYIKVYENTLLDGRMCLCGMLASDAPTLPIEIQEFVKSFFVDNEKWLAEVLRQGRKEGVFTFRGDEDDQSQFILSSVQGALLVSRAAESREKFKIITNELIKSLTFSD